MKLLFILIGVALLLLVTVGCSTAPTTSTLGAPGPMEGYPKWLNMDKGYAEACAASPTGCTPFTEEEIQQLLNIVHQRTLEMCGKKI